MRRGYLRLLAFLSAPVTAAPPHWRVGSMTEAGPHPRSAGIPEDLPALRERITREPYLSLCRTLPAIALRGGDLLLGADVVCRGRNAHRRCRT
ncbi:MAG: hypothetical protein HY904_17150 [Deltaproteobacteria bacterium]|nr:hypothetical protein [Deltaproteobacteria bacterium]